MRLLRLVNLAVRFLLELGALAAVGYWGGTVPAGAAARTVLAIGLPCLVATFWGLFVSPKAPVRSGLMGRAVLGFVVFAAAAAALQSRGHARLAGVLLAVAAVSSVLFATERAPRV